MWDLPRPGLKPVFPALAGRFLTAEPPGKPCSFFLSPNTGSRSVAGSEFQSFLKARVESSLPNHWSSLEPPTQVAKRKAGRKGFPKRPFTPKYGMYLSAFCQGVSQLPRAKAPLLLLCWLSLEVGHFPPSRWLDSRVQWHCWSGLCAGSTWTPCRGIHLSVSPQAPGAFGLLPYPCLQSPWTEMNMTFGKGLLNKVCSRLPLRLSWGINRLSPTPLQGWLTFQRKCSAHLSKAAWKMTKAPIKCTLWGRPVAKLGPDTLCLSPAAWSEVWSCHSRSAGFIFIWTELHTRLDIRWSTFSKN